MGNEDLWGWGTDSEQVWDDLGEAIDAYIQDSLLGKVEPGDELEVAKFERLVLPENPPSGISWVIEKILENLDEDFGNVEDWTEPSEALEKDIWEVVKKHYNVWRCDPTGYVETIDLYEWAQKFSPEYLED